MIKEYPLEHIIGDVVEACKDSGEISITESLLSAGTYICTATNKFYLLYKRKYITISGTANFNGEFLIENIDYENKTFEIKSETGFESETGNYVADFPYYTHEKWVGLTEILQNLTSVIVEQPRRFPRLFLRHDISKDWQRADLYNVNLDLFLIINTEQNKRADWRVDNTMKFLTKFKNVFLKRLSENEYIQNIGFINHNETKRYYNFTQEVNQNKINSLVDVIELNIKDLKVREIKECIL